MTTEPAKLDLEALRELGKSHSLTDFFELCDEVERLRQRIAKAKSELEAAYTLPWLEGGREWPIENRVKAALEALQ